MKILTQEELIVLNKACLSSGVLDLECRENKRKPKDAIAHMLEFVNVWRACGKKMADSSEKTRSGMVGGDAKKVFHCKEFLAGPLVRNATFYALAVSESNAMMGKIVAAPTAGSAGVIPGVLLALGDAFSLPDERLAKSLFAAAGIGIIIFERASFAGSAVGCQGEVGSAAAMAAAAAVDLMGGDSRQACNAASLSLKNMLGLACDPIAGLVEVPCVRRNAMGASHALTAASLALCGVESVLPFEEIASAMAAVGSHMDPAIKETSKGGLAVTPTGKRICLKTVRPTGKFQ